MQKLFCLMLCLLGLMACSNKGNQFVGTWQNEGLKNVKLAIARNSKGDNYTVTIKTLVKKNPFAAFSDDKNPNAVREDNSTYQATLVGDILNTTLPLGIVVPAKIVNDELIFEDGRGCDKCTKYKKL